MDKNITQIYKNTGLLAAFNIPVIWDMYDIDGLTAISSSFKKHILKNIEIINENVCKDFNNTILNYGDKFDPDSELMLIIYADFSEKMNLLLKETQGKSS